MTKKAIESFLLYKFIILGIAWMGMYLTLKRAPQGLQEFLDYFSYWDTNWFIQTASSGYNTDTPSIQNFPLYPFSFKLLDYLIGNLKLSALIIAQIGSFFAFYFFYQVARLELGEKSAKTALVLFAFFPTAYFLTASYSEPLTMATVMGSIYFARTNRFPQAGLMAMLATLGRTQSMALIPGVLALIILNPKMRNKKELLNWSWIILGALMGYLIYLGINKIVYGEFFYYLRFISEQFGAQSTWPLRNLYLTLTLNYQAQHCSQWVCVNTPSIFIIILILGLIPIWKSKNRFDFGYSCGILFLLSSIDLWISHPRYTLMVYPLIIHTASFFDKSKLRLSLYLLFSGIFLGYFWISFIWKDWAF